MTAAVDESDIPLPEIRLPDRTDHPVLAAILSDLQVRARQPVVVAHYEDAP
ncbi:hypothetical protein AB5J56_16090 [Streptomyces sp. R21]|uniref:Uncharacterized protein n=1 Tax=Streptomyces sp. R21 TaxID=3238627 RepID=A0AB39P6V6_9ACTN